MQGCGSESVTGSGFNGFVDPDPDWEYGSRGKKMKKISTFLVDLFIFIMERYINTTNC
jgi:hypothetical protein